MGRRRWALVAALPLLLSACGEGDGDATTGSATGSEPSAGAVPIDVADAGALGEVLVDGEGTTHYMFDPDKQGESTCYEQCATARPPLIGQASVGEGADDSKLGSVARTDGSQQVTYNGWRRGCLVGAPRVRKAPQRRCRAFPWRLPTVATADMVKPRAMHRDGRACAQQMQRRTTASRCVSPRTRHRFDRTPDPSAERQQHPEAGQHDAARDAEFPQ